jgi:hypothetical protein
MGIPGYFKWLTDKDHYPDIKRNCVEYEPSFGNYFNEYVSILIIFILISR